jgi:hypothetical protein
VGAMRPSGSVSSAPVSDRSVRRLRSLRARLPFTLGLAVALGACLAADPEPAEDANGGAQTGEEQDLISISNLVALARGKVDRSRPDPYNPWAKKKLGVGEENRLPDEDAEFLRIGKLVNRFQTEAQTEGKEARPSRAFHAKSHACVKGTLTVDNAALPEAARVGLFAENKSYATYTRFSNGVGSKQEDRKLDVRGLAFKIVGVAGERVLTNPGDDTATTQDFLLANQPFAPHTNPTTMMAFGEVMSAAKNTTSILGKIDSVMAIGSYFTSDENVRLVDFLANHALPKTKAVGSLLGDTYWTGAPNALGLEEGHPATARAKGAMKLKAVTGVLEGAVCKPVSAPPGSDRDFLRKDFEQRFASSRVCIELSLQRQLDGESESLEDVSVEWQTPFVSVGRVVFEPQALTIENPDQAACNEFTFQPWHTIAAHRPLGNAQRARRIALPSSAAFRHATAVEPSTETDGPVPGQAP